jgi:hypothetical protein
MQISRLVLASLLVAVNASAQTIDNGSLTGPPGLSILPAGWVHLFPNCDTEDANGPHELYNLSPDGGTFVAGAHAVTQPPLGVEAFQGTVTGLTPGHVYTLTFYQSNLGAGETNLGGSWGAVASWQLYLDGVATGLFSEELQPEVGPLPNNTWFASSITFTATAATHALGFGPHSTNGKNAFLGIDGIAIQAVVSVEGTSWGQVKALFLE